MTHRYIFLGIVLGLSTLGCAKPHFVYDTPPGTLAQKYGTIALDPRMDRLFLIKGKRQLNDPETKDLVFAELQSKGYRLVPPDQAELWVGAYLFMESREQSHTESPGGGGHTSGGGHGGMNHGGHSAAIDGGTSHSGGESHSKGSGLSLLVELIARPTLERVWAGTGDLVSSEKAAHDHNPATEDRAHTILKNTVKRLLEPLDGYRSDEYARHQQTGNNHP